MPNMITKIAKRFLTGSVLLGAVALAPRDACDRLVILDPSRGLAGFMGSEDPLGSGRPDAVQYGGPDAVLSYGGLDTNPLFITDEEH